MRQSIQRLTLALACLGSYRAFLVPRALPDPTVRNSTLAPSSTSRTTSSNNPDSSTALVQNTGGFIPDHPEWSYLNSEPWFHTDKTQQDHMRYHAYVSLASYGDYETLCPLTFKEGFHVLQKFNTNIGQSGFVVHIPEMNKVVIVFKGRNDISSIDWTPVSITDLLPDCAGCMAAKGIKDLYMSAKQQTNNWELAKSQAAALKVKFSVTGHAIGGAVATLAALDLGKSNHVHYSHHQATPRALNYESVVVYDNLFQVLAGQSLIAENDYLVQSVPPGPFFHVGTSVKILGDKQQYLINCYGNNENSTCIGDGSDYRIQDTYFTQKGLCGSSNKGW